MRFIMIKGFFPVNCGYIINVFVKFNNFFVMLKNLKNLRCY